MLWLKPVVISPWWMVKKSLQLLFSWSCSCYSAAVSLEIICEVIKLNADGGFKGNAIQSVSVWQSGSRQQRGPLPDGPGQQGAHHLSRGLREHAQFQHQRKCSLSACQLKHFWNHCWWSFFLFWFNTSPSASHSLFTPCTEACSKHISTLPLITGSI